MTRDLHVLHLSALPIWPLAGKGGMPSLRETLRGHVRSGHRLTVILPEYTIFGVRIERIEVPEDSEYDVVIAPCPWLLPLKSVLRGILRVFHTEKPPYLLRWGLNLLTCLLLTVSLVGAALKMRYRQRRVFDLVYAHNQYAALAGFLLRLVFRVPNVTRLYGTFLADLMGKPLVWLRYPVASAGFLVPSALVICGNDGTRGDDVARRLHVRPERFRFWQNGVDLPASPPEGTREDFAASGPLNLRTGSIWVCSCSRLSYWKRIDRIIRAVALSRQAGHDCQLLLAGSGTERPALEALARELGVEREIIWLGVLAHDEIWRVMNLSDVFMITNDVTNRCNPLYEAICASLPVLSVRDASTADLLKDNENALLADRDDLETLGKHLARLCSDPQLRDRLAQAQATRAETFWTWEERMEEEARTLSTITAVQQGTRST